MYKQLFELTRELVDIPSITGEEEVCQEFLARLLENQGYHVELQPVSGRRANVLAFSGAPELVLSTHIDTVPPFFPSSEDDEFIRGRGSCDAKGIVASQVVAAQRLRNEGVGDFGLMFLVGEETVSDGAQEANRRPHGTKFLINGEPTENKLALGSKGVLRVDIHAQGRMAHSAYPHLGDSAIDKLLDALQALRRVPLPHDSLLGPSTLNIGLISGGRAANVVPDRAQAQVLIRTVTDSLDLRRQIEQVLGGHVEYEFVRDTPALRMDQIPGFDTDVVAFTTDVPSLTAFGRPFLMGPGSIGVAHTEHECVRKTDLIQAVDLYCKLVKILKTRQTESWSARS